MSERQRPDQWQRKRRRWRTYLDSIKADWPVLTLVRSAFIGTLVLVLVGWVFPQQSPIVSPDLVGVSRIAAVGQLKGNELNLRTTDSEISGLLPALPQEAPPPPPPSPQVPVPDVVGRDLATAARTLRQNGLTVGSVTEEESNRRAAGDVLRTEPTAGTGLQPHSRVNLVVADPKTPVLRPVPDVVGYDQATATRTLRQNGLEVGSVREEESNQRAAGEVLRIEPTAGAEVPPHSRVDLVVAE